MMSIKCLSVCTGVGTVTSLHKQELSLDFVSQESSPSIVVTIRNTGSTCLSKNRASKHSVKSRYSLTLKVALWGCGLSHPPLWNGGSFWEGGGLPVAIYVIDTWNDYLKNKTITKTMYSQSP